MGHLSSKEESRTPIKLLASPGEAAFVDLRTWVGEASFSQLALRLLMERLCQPHCFNSCTERFAAAGRPDGRDGARGSPSIGHCSRPPLQEGRSGPPPPPSIGPVPNWRLPRSRRREATSECCSLYVEPAPQLTFLPPPD